MGATIEELRQDVVELSKMSGTYLEKFYSALVSKDGSEIASALTNWFTLLDSNDRAFKFLDITPMLREPSIFWRALHMNWTDFGAIPHSRFARLFHRFRQYWRKEYLMSIDEHGYDELPDVVTVYKGQERGREVGLAWTQDIATADYDARLCKLPIIIEAQVAKRDVAAIWFNWNRSNLLLFSPNAAAERREIAIHKKV